MPQQLIFTEQFRRDIQRLRFFGKQIAKQINLFLSDKKHPSLRVKKLNPKEEYLYSFRINKQYRIIFTYQKKDIVLLYISKHYE